MKDRNASDVNSDVAPAEQQWHGKSDDAVVEKWSNVQDGHSHFAEKYENGSGGLSVAVNGDACILCQACLIECEGECITIVDDNGTEYHSIYK
jgi:NAD-dependent dihydropyrimidine dehydrogenase PreA subunit